MTISFDFIGGPLDGQHSSNACNDEVRGWYLMTHKGTIGKRFGTLVIEKDDTGAAVGLGTQPHFYEVIERFQEGDEVIVKAKFLGTDESFGK